VKANRRKNSCHKIVPAHTTIYARTLSEDTIH